MNKKLIVGALVALVFLAIVGWFFIFYAPKHFKRDVADEKGIQITASALVTAFQTNETNANTIYLDKPIEIKGEIGEIKTDQEGKTVVTLKSADAFAGILSTLKTADTSLKVGQTITIKGICTGFLSDVVLKEAIIVK
jgi:hypothetical protein